MDARERAYVAGIHVLLLTSLAAASEGVDGRDKPGHDDVARPCVSCGHGRLAAELKGRALYRAFSPRTTGWPMPSGLASTRTKAARATSLPRLTQAWFVPRWTITSPALSFTVEPSMSISSSPCITIT